MINLQTYRSRHNLTFRQLGDMLDISSETRVRAMVIGKEWPKPLRLERVLRTCAGVSVEAMFQLHLKWHKDHPPIVDGAIVKKAPVSIPAE